MNDILIFNLDAQQRPFCDTFYPDFEVVIPQDLTCYNPKFFQDVAKQIKLKPPSLCVFSFQNTHKEDLFFTQFLPNYMYYGFPEQYVEIKTQIDKYLPGGNQPGGMTLAVYAANELVVNDVKVEKDVVADFYSQGIYLTTTIGKMIVINIYHIGKQTEYDQQSIDKLLKYYIEPDTDMYILNINRVHGITFNLLKRHRYYDLELNDIRSNFSRIEVIRKAPKILCFAWNTDRIPLCDQYYGKTKTELLNKHRRGRWWASNECYNPLFFEDIKNKILEELPNMVVISTQGDLEKGTFFHHEFLPSEMSNLGYELLTKDKVPNMRLSIYINVHYNLLDLRDNFTCYKKGEDAKTIVKYVETDVGVVGLISVEIPHTYNIVDQGTCMKAIVSQLVTPECSYVIVMGDFSIHEPPAFNAEALKRYYPESRIIDKAFNEGDYIVPNYQRKTKDKTIVSWHNRIYYAVYGLASAEIRVLYYNVVNAFPMVVRGTEEFHLGVMGVFEFSPIVLDEKEKAIEQRETEALDGDTSDDWTEYSENEPVDIPKISKLSCNQLGGLVNKFSNNSCYIDSVLMILLSHDNPYMNDYILNANIPETPLANSIRLIQQDLRDIKKQISSGIFDTCIQLRRDLQDYVKFAKLPAFNWKTEQQEPRDLMSILRQIFNIPDLAIIKLSSWVSNDSCDRGVIKITEEQRTVSIGINIGVDELTEMIENETISLESYINGTVCTEFDEQNYFSYKDKYYKIYLKHQEYIQAPMLWIHVDRLNIDTKIRTKLMPLEYISLKDNSKPLELVGIIIHRGSDEGGHYMSYIKCQDVWYLVDDLASTIWREIGDYNKVLKDTSGSKFFDHNVSVLTDATDYFYL